MHAPELQTAPLKSRRRPKVRTGKFSDFPQKRTGTKPPVAEKPASAKSPFGAINCAGTCIREKVLDAADNVTDTKYYAWGLDLSQSTQGAGGVGGLVAMMDGDAGTTYYYAYDANGNVGQLVDGGDNSIAARYEYDAFGGEIVSDGVMADSNQFRFSTKYTDENGLVYYGKRYYIAELGRWLNRDPIGEEGGVNLYTLGLNNVIDDFDILGLSTKRNCSSRSYDIFSGYVGEGAAIGLGVSVEWDICDCCDGGKLKKNGYKKLRLHITGTEGFGFGGKFKLFGKGFEGALHLPELNFDVIDVSGCIDCTGESTLRFGNKLDIDLGLKAGFGRDFWGADVGGGTTISGSYNVVLDRRSLGYEIKFEIVADFWFKFSTFGYSNPVHLPGYPFTIFEKEWKDKIYWSDYMRVRLRSSLSEN